jgi:hypothetical protein
MSKNTRLKARIVVLFLLLVLPVPVPVPALDATEACDGSGVGGADDSRVDASWLVIGVGDCRRRGVVTWLSWDGTKESILCWILYDGLFLP